ncbi:M13 family metallopeptidase [Legionella hackeliae]|uniref:Metallopeptidase PepO, peptidase, M13 family n=1 Tax=Legionella hackeliae TaxID=449 RepID=A0A0A8USM2_LEGHA|nr:M13 family metallopeptidase [Legionella hackeliae]KTD10559.1 metallopeptidase PepO, peptidase, M13 family transporter [Legionella hackeliae]CEK10062.1 Metallopeptidase PepO, peptidase, M13 family [Legionella hackeliae]STX46788.1 metallopeptidase PepO [Legionella hackeliae]
MRLRKIFTALLSFCTPFIALSATNANAASLHLDWLDKSMNPGENFFAYANGNWQKQNPIPPEYESWGTFYVIQDKLQNVIHQMLIAAANDKNAKPGSIEQKVGDFYFSGMDETLINKVGATPLKPEFDRIEAIRNTDELQTVIAHLQMIGVDALFGVGSMQDFKNSQEMIGAVIQAGIGLPDRDYYLKDDKKFAQIREAYLQHLTKMFELLGDSPEKAAKEAKAVMAIETTLAKASLSQTELRDPYTIYHIMDRKQLAAATPNFSWPRYLTAIGQSHLQSINLATPDFFKKVNEMIPTISLDDWKIYLRWRLIDSFASYLSQPFVDQNFKMTSAIGGAEKLLPRWKRVVNTENGALGFAIGKLYVEKYFSSESKQQVMDILQNIRKVLRQDLQTLAWMAPETRQAALKKLDLMEERVGYPEKWWDYSTLKVDRGPYVLNVIRANEFLVKRDLNKIGKPVDRTEWHMTPQTINAYYDPSMNNINLPAGILQPPFFDPKAPAAVNYGAIGFIIGHEITHGFDDKGALFDGHGNLKNWWTSEDLKKFQAATNCIADQFSQYKVNGDLSVQGNLVVGEATADLGGLTLAYKAFQSSKEFKDAPTIAGFTPEQQFFLGSAHVWASNIRPEKARDLVTTDPHPPMIYRVNGTLANMPEFQMAFSLLESSPMVNKNRCVIW